MMTIAAERPTPPTTARSRAFVAAHREAAEALGARLAELVDEPENLAAELEAGLGELADPGYLAGQQRVAPGIGPLHGVRAPLLAAVGSQFRRRTRGDRPSRILPVADRLLREPRLEARWFALALLEPLVARDPERSWQLLRRAARGAGDWITVDTLARPCGRGILAEAYRWAELEQLVYAPSRWERRLVGSTIATIPSLDRAAGRVPEVASRGLALIGELIGDAESDVQKALSWALRTLARVDRPATTAFLAAETERAAATRDGHRAWVVRDSLPKLAPDDARRLRARLDRIRRQPDAPATSRASAIAGQFASMGLGATLPEPPLA